MISLEQRRRFWREKDVKMLLNCLIIDDEHLARRRFHSLIDQKHELHILAECKTGQQAIIEIDALKPDVIFLDIEKKDMTGFEVLRQITHQPLVVFVTAYKDYAIKAFDFFAFDYLLKPFNKKRFDVTIDRIVSFHHEPLKDSRVDELLMHLEKLVSPSKTASNKKRLSIKNRNEVFFVDYDDVMYIKAQGNYVKLYTLEKSYLVRSPLNTFSDENANDFLMRVHRSTIVNINFISKVVYSEYAEIDVKMQDGSLFRVSNSYKKTVQKLLGI